MSEWKNFGVVDGILWIRGLGIAVRTTFNFNSYPGMHRFWPFVFMWVPKHER